MCILRARSMKSHITVIPEVNHLIHNKPLFSYTINWFPEHKLLLYQVGNYMEKYVLEFKSVTNKSIKHIHSFIYILWIEIYIKLL